MHLRFLGHAAFDLTLGGVRLCLDPHKPGALGGRFQLPLIQGPFDALVHSHHHEDHAAWTPALGTTRSLDPPCTLGGVTLEARAVPHDDEGGLRMGLTRMISLRGEGLRIVHSGDIGSYSAADAAWLADTDVLLLACGGTWTLGPDQAAALVRAVKPRIVVPMHCADPRVDLALRPTAAFVRAFGCEAAVLEQLEGDTVAAADATQVIVLAAP